MAGFECWLRDSPWYPRWQGSGKLVKMPEEETLIRQSI
jgi:hypothetical protein